MNKLETKLKDKVYDFLDKEIGGWWVKLTGSIFIKRGVPDIIGIFKDGDLIIPCFIEIKTEKGEVSKIQEITIKKIQNNGGCAFIARSIDDVKKEINAYKKMFNL